MPVRSSLAELAHLEAQARAQGARLIYSRDVQRGGHCLLRGKPVVLLGSRLSAEEKIEVLQAFFSSALRQPS